MTTFIEIMNNEDTREIVEHIEEIECRLESFEDGDESLEIVRKNLIEELATHGYEWKEV
ncbi:MAG: hypothetical protein GY774_04825 [Planctomycetes bacterium]|nr:hypothetical protein [Planctomycetota bacterium]